jgi:hypothetical protein
MAAALEDDQFQTFLRKLRRDFPMEKAEHMLDSLGIEIARERAAYYTDHEYAASLLGVTQEELDRIFGQNSEPPPSPPVSQVRQDPQPTLWQRLWKSIFHLFTPTEVREKIKRRNRFDAS